MTTISRTVAVAIALITAGCGGQSGHPPIARIRVQPEYVPVHDGYQTDVVLDGSGSADPVDDPLGTRPLLYQWSVADPNAPILPDPSAAIVTIRIAGEAPVQVSLTVADGSDDKTTVDATVGISAP